MEKLNDFFKKWNFYNDSTYLPYQLLLDEFKDEKEHPAGNGKTLQKVYLDDEKLVMRFKMPKGTIFKSNYHDCKEIINVVYGEIKWIERNMYYNTATKITIPRDIKHSFLALEDTLAYAILYNPNEK